MTPKATSTILIISMILNLILVGLFAGAFLKRTTHQATDRPPPRSSALTAEERDFSRQFFEDAFAKTKAARDTRAATQMAVHDAILSDPIDIARIEALLNRHAESEANLRKELQQNLKEKLPNMTDAQRALIASRIFMQRRGPPDRRRRSERRRPRP